MATQEYEVRAWLGPISAETDDETVAAIIEAWDRITELYGEDEEGAQEARETAGAWVLGDATVRRQVKDWQKAQVEAARAFDQLKGVMVAADLHGEPIARIAAEVGITRTTVYSWLGKA